MFHAVVSLHAKHMPICAQQLGHAAGTLIMIAVCLRLLPARGPQPASRGPPLGWAPGIAAGHMGCMEIPSKAKELEQNPGN